VRTVARRVLQLIVVLIVVTFFTSLLTALLPGDPVTLIAPFASVQEKAAIRQQLHLDDNVVQRYGVWLKNFASGDMGREYAGTGIRGTDI
jgi:peptide/nickel transport system permease protein